MKRISIPEAAARVPRCAILNNVTEGTTTQEQRRAGLCFDCEHSHRIQSARGSTFYRCKLSDTDPSFAKYPRLPVLQCAGYKRRASES
ncbi:MAG: hypothetical protein WB711_18520 [Terriglobales bacterium]